jgi:hypothetical protein
MRIEFKLMATRASTLQLLSVGHGQIQLKRQPLELCRFLNHATN